jgi:hypothetical protein
MARSASSVVAASVDIPNGWACYPGRGHMGQVRCCLGQPKLHSPSFEMGRESRFQQWPGGPNHAHPFLLSLLRVGGAESQTANGSTVSPPLPVRGARISSKGLRCSF